jgi:hypothetical protein
MKTEGLTPTTKNPRADSRRGIRDFHVPLHLERTIVPEPNVEATFVNRKNFVLLDPTLHMSPFLPSTLDTKTRDAYRGWSLTD